MFDDLVEFLPLVSGLKTVDTANGQQALQTSVYRARIIRTKQLHSDIKEPGPLFREVMLKDLLE